MFTGTGILVFDEKSLCSALAYTCIGPQLHIYNCRDTKHKMGFFYFFRPNPGISKIVCNNDSGSHETESLP